MINFKVLDSYDEVSRAVGMVIADEIKATLKIKDHCVIGLATGSTPIGVYKTLIELNQKGELDFSKVISFNLDEYIGLPASHVQSFAYFMYSNLFDHINIKKENVHIPSGTETDYDAYCKKYESMIKEAGGIDIQLLGIGSNGHIGFNEPADSFSNITHTVELTQSTIKDNSRFFENIDEVPKTAITMGIGTILSARRIVMIITGENKKPAVKYLFTKKISPCMPASALWAHSDVTMIVDKESGSF